MTAKKIYEIGEIPNLGEVPEEMYAWVIREDRLGLPEKAMQIEKMPVQKPGRDEVLVMVMAVGINYNNVWASQGIPISVIGKDTGYHISGSDASGIVCLILKAVSGRFRFSFCSWFGAFMAKLLWPLRDFRGAVL